MAELTPGPLEVDVEHIVLKGPDGTAVEAIHACILLHGWIGYDQDLPHEQRLRDVIGLEIGDGTPEIMKAVIARETFGREFAPHR